MPHSESMKMKLTVLIITLLFCGCGNRNSRQIVDAETEQTEPTVLIAAEEESPINPADSVWVNTLHRIKLPESIRPDRLINVYFKYNPIVNGYEVTARWFPFDAESGTGLLVMNFRNTRNGQSFQYVETDKYSSPDIDRIRFVDGFTGHRNGDIHYLDYVSPDTPDDYKEYNNNSPIGYYTSFQFTDVDFDGEKELLINGWEQGQGGNSYAVYKVNGNTLVKMDCPPFNSIDNMTFFDEARKQIAVCTNDSAFNVARAIYRLNPNHKITDRIYPETLDNSGEWLLKNYYDAPTGLFQLDSLYEWSERPNAKFLYIYANRNGKIALVEKRPLETE